MVVSKFAAPQVVAVNKTGPVTSYLHHKSALIFYIIGLEFQLKNFVCLLNVVFVCVYSYNQILIVKC